MIELRAGNRVRAIELASAPARPCTRAARQFETSLVQEAVNIKTACMRLEFLLYANFALTDWFVTLTYDDWHLPPGFDAARKNQPAYFRKLRAHRRATGLPFDYVYVMEGLHGEHRVHHHFVTKRAPGDTRQLFADLWQKGYVDIQTIGEFGGYRAVARYMTKEPRKTGKLRVGARMWTPSKGLIQPERNDIELAPGEHYQPPTGATAFEGAKFPERIENTFGTFTTFDFEIPEITTSHI